MRGAEHSKQPLLLFCLDCKVSLASTAASYRLTRGVLILKVCICVLCRDYGSHNGHKIDLLKNVANKLRVDIQGCVAQASQLAAQLHREAEAAVKAVAGFSSSEH